MILIILLFALPLAFCANQSVSSFPHSIKNRPIEVRNGGPNTFFHYSRHHIPPNAPKIFMANAQSAFFPKDVKITPSNQVAIQTTNVNPGLNGLRQKFVTCENIASSRQTNPLIFQGQKMN